MATDNLPATVTNLPTRWSEPSLGALAEPLRLAKGQAFAFLPIVDRASAEQIPAIIDQLEIGLLPSSQNEIERMMLKIALIYPAGKLGTRETDEKLALYLDLLADIPFDILSAAFRKVAQAGRFFPTVAEIRAAAMPALNDRVAKVTTLRMLLLKHEQHPRSAPTDDQPCSPAEVEEMNRVMRRLVMKTRYHVDGTGYELADGDDDPAPAADESEQQVAA